MNNINVFAASSITGGVYNKIRVFGAADINGDVTAESLSVYGAADFNGNCDIKDMSIKGACDFKGYVKAVNLDVKGACDFNGDVHIEFLKIYGAVSFKQKVSRATDIKIYGVVEVETLEADTIMVKGVLECKEQLNADFIEINSNSESEIKEIVGSKIIIQPDKKMFKKLGKPVVVDLVEGDEIELENVKAKVVRGNTVKIGKYCEIERVEYNDTLVVSNKSDVKESEKIE